MRRRRGRKIFLFFLMGLSGMLLLVFLVLNLPFSQRFATKKANQILSSSSVPIHLDGIRKIMPGSVKIQGIVIKGIQGDTIIYAGELQADIRLVSLLRSKVMLKDVVLDGALVELDRNTSAQKINIAAAFQSGKPRDAVPIEKPPARWEISIREGVLTNIHFRMNDSLTGIHIVQDAREIEIGSFLVSIPEREISCKSLFLGEADGLVNLTPRLLAPKKKGGSPWNFGFHKLELDDVDFAFSNSADSLLLEVSIGKGNIRANEFDLPSRTADFKLISFDESIVTVQKKQEDDEEESFQWNIRSENIDIKNSAARLGPEPGDSFKEIDVRVDDLRLNEDQAGMKLKKIGFEMGNGFTLKKLSGELDSNKDQTRLQLDIKTGNSRLELKASADKGYQDILSAPGEISNGTVNMERSQISVHDLACFIEDLEALPFYASLIESDLDMEGSLDVEGPLFSLSGFTVSQEKNFNFKLEGDINKPKQFSEATGDLDLEISGLDQAWLEKLLAGFGISYAVPDLSDLKIYVNVSDSLESPDFNVAVASYLGDVDLAGTLDFNKELFNMAYAFHRISLGDLLYVPDLGSFTGAGEIKGKGFSGEDLNASFYLQIDTLGFKSYNYSLTQLTGTLVPGEYEVQMVANDPSLKGDLNVGLSLADSAFDVQLSGILHAQLNDLHLYNNTLAVETTIDASLSSRGKELESEISANGLTFATPLDTAVVRELNASYLTDNVTSLLHVDADFFHFDLHVAQPINELDSLGKTYQEYGTEFQFFSQINETDRVTDLPEIRGTGHMSYHELIDIFIEDTSFYFNDLDVSIIKQHGQNSLRGHINGTEMSYKMIETGKLNVLVTDSAGILLVDIVSDSTSLFAGPLSRWMINGEFSNLRTLTRLSVDDYQGRNLYQIEVAGQVDSQQIVLEIPSQLLTLNRAQWHMEKPDLLLIDLSTNTVLPDFLMKRDSSYIQMNARRQDQENTYKLHMKQVELGSLIRNDVFRGEPDGTFTGFVDFSSRMDGEKNVATALQIKDVRYYGEDFDDIHLDAEYTWGKSDAYSIDLHARMDTLGIQVKGEKFESGERNLDGVVSHFPLVNIEPFTKDYLSELGGSISGNFNIAAQTGTDQFNGELMFEDVLLKVNFLNSMFRIPSQRIVIADERLVFDHFTVLDTLNKPLHIDGLLDFEDLGSVKADLIITSTELQVMKRNMDDKVLFTGNVFVDSRFSIEGPVANPSVAGRLHLSEGTEIFYHHMEDLRVTESQKIVNFVSHSSLGEAITSHALSSQPNFINSSIETIIEIDPSTRINFSLAKRMFDIDLNVEGGGNVQYSLENEQAALSGKYEIGEGDALLKMVGWPDKSFRLAKGGYIRWDGIIEDPEMNIEAENKVSTSYLNPIDGRNRNIDFFVILKLSGYLTDLDVLFTIRTPDQYVMSIINALSPEEQMRQAISVLLFEIVDLPGISSSTDYMTQQVSQVLTSQLNQLTESTIKGVDISFGIDTYDQTTPAGAKEATTSLSYEVSKSLMNNRAQIEISGRLNDGTQQSSTYDNSLNNVSFEYTLDSAASKYLKVYNEHTYDDVFEGEVIRTGIGFSYRKRYKTLKDIWKRKK